MKTALATIAALGLTIGAAAANCMGDTASHETGSTMASASVPASTTDTVYSGTKVDSGITTGAIETQDEE